MDNKNNVRDIVKYCYEKANEYDQKGYNAYWLGDYEASNKLYEKSKAYGDRVETYVSNWKKTLRYNLNKKEKVAYGPNIVPMPQRRREDIER